MDSEVPPNLVIFDTDMGCDDAWAIQMLLKAEQLLKNIRVIAITTVAGNTSTENAIKNTYHILRGLNRSDIPIYKGATEGIIPFVRKRPPFHGVNGFSDIEFWQENYPSDINSIIQPKNAIQAIRDLVMEYPNQITLICVGPLTNIALALKTFPEVKENIKEVFMMGGNHRGRGNHVAAAEFNFHADPIAAHTVLRTLECPMTVVTLECGHPESISIPLDWRFNVLGNSECRNVQFLNRIERIAYRERKFFTPFDAMLSAVFLFPEKIIRTKCKYHAMVEIEGFHTRGQMVIDLRNDNHNVTVIESVIEEEFKNILLWTAE